MACHYKLIIWDQVACSLSPHFTFLAVLLSASSPSTKQRILTKSWCLTTYFFLHLLFPTPVKRPGSNKNLKCEINNTSKALQALARLLWKKNSNKPTHWEGSSKINYIIIYGKLCGYSALSITDLLINTAYVTPVSLSISLFIKSNPLDLINVFILIWASIVLSIVLSPSIAQCVFLSSAAWP